MKPFALGRSSTRRFQTKNKTKKSNKPCWLLLLGLSFRKTQSLFAIHHIDMSGIFRLILGGDQKKEDSNTGSSEAPPQPESTSSPSNATDTNTASTTPAVESADEIRRKRLNMFSGSSGGGASPSNKTKSVDSMDTRDDFATPSKPVSNLGQRATPPSSITTTTRSTTPTKTTPTSASSSSSMEISKSPITRVETMDGMYF